MTTHAWQVVLTAANATPAPGLTGSKTVSSGDAFADTTSVNSTLSVAANAYLLSYAGGDGADISDFTSVTVNGLVAGYGSAYDGIYNFLTSTTNALALTVGAAGQVYGYEYGVESLQTDHISNYGTITGKYDSGIYEHSAVFGAFSLTNYASGQVVGYDYGLYQTAASNSTQTIVNSGLIEGEFDEAVYLTGTGATTITNGATGRMIGEDSGIYDENSSGAQAISNAGLIEGYDDEAVYFDNTAGSIKIGNGATGRIVGDYGIYDDDSSGAFTVNNLGLIEGGDAFGVDLDTISGAISITNAVNAQIYGGYDDGIYIDDALKGVTIANSGLIEEGGDGYGIYLEDVTGAVNISNAATAQIIGTDDYGIYVDGVTGALTIKNAGLIEGGYSYGLYLEDMTGLTTIANSATGQIVGGDEYGIYLDELAGVTISNAGEIEGGDSYGIYLDDITGPTTITNAATGRIVGGDDVGIYVYRVGRSDDQQRRRD